MLDPSFSRLYAGLYHGFPDHGLLRGLTRLLTPDGLSHVLQDDELLCGGPVPAGCEPDTAWQGKDALDLATCVHCRGAATRIAACAEIEAEAAEQAAGPVARLAADRIIDPSAPKNPERTAADVDSLEYLSFAWMWASLLGLLALAAVGLLGLGLLLAFLGSAQRLGWLLLKPSLLRQ